MIMTQVELQQKTREGIKKYIAFIPSKFANKNKYLSIKNDDNEYETWQVINVYACIEKDKLDASNEAYRTLKYILNEWGALWIGY